MKYKEKNNMYLKGISLIVLVITMIIIIIIAGAVILNLTQNNPISEAKRAKFLSDIDTFNSELSLYVLKEQAKSRGQYDKAQLYANSNSVTENGNKDTSRTIGNVITSMNNTKYIDKIEISEGNLVYVGGLDEEENWFSQVIKPSGGGSSLLTAKVNLGDYITYTSSQKTSYVSTSDTGTQSMQGFDPQNTTLWRVLEKDESTGAVSIISSGSVGDLTLKGMSGYGGAVRALDNIANMYINLNYANSARSIVSGDYEKLQQAGVLDIGEAYWLASTNSATVDGRGSSYTYWRVYCITERASSSYEELYYINNMSHQVIDRTETCGVRPIIILKENLLITGGSGTSDAPYIIGI